jgi:ATP-dependent DNA helicase RecG
MKSEEVSLSFRLRGVGPQIAKHLARLDIHSVQDLLLHLPSRYQDRTQVQLIANLRVDDDAVIEGEILNVARPKRGKTKLLCELRDQSGRVTLRFFHVLTYQADAFKVGNRLRCYGVIREGLKGLEMTHPEFQQIRPEKPLPIEPYLTAFYPATEGLSQHMLRKLTTNALVLLEANRIFPELLPAELLQKFMYPSLREAIKFVHRPPNHVPISDLMENKTLAQRRMIFEELIAHRISLLQLKKTFQSQVGISLSLQQTLTQSFLQQLPFALTGAQQRVVQEISQDLMRPHPMLRLVQGDVGSGKTVVAALAMLQALENHQQAAMMAPTELLAEQHYRNFQRWMEPLNINVVYLSGHVKGRARAQILEKIQSGEAQIVLGTHALFQENVTFAKLALVVVDEQHRFGVEQRAQFREKGKQENIFPHQLVMTATPIPRTLAMSFYADLDVSVIDELPPNRTPITTSVIASSRRDEIIARIRDACEQGRQVYWVCPLIEESEVLNCQAATHTAELLQTCLPNQKVDLVHGRMRPSEKDAAMQAFQAGATNVLVATTVIEVGVDVPNASVMVIENAERLGLSQLHQLRGRVGRGSVASYCILLYQNPVSKLGRERLAVMRESTDGFRIAQRDLELRGPGEVLGTRQTGELAFSVADLIRDSDLLPAVHDGADFVMQHYPEVIEPLLSRWLGRGYEYGKV